MKKYILSCILFLAGFYCYAIPSKKLMSPYEFEITKWEFRPVGTKKWIQDFEFQKNYFQIYYSLFQKDNSSKNKFEQEQIINQYFNSITWEFRTIFDNTKYLENHPNTLLILNRVNTFCDVLINDKKIKFLKNAFVEYKIDISPYLKKGKNEIKLIFYPSHTYAKNNLISKNFQFPSDNQKDSLKTAPYIRQKQSDFGWDFVRPSYFFGLKTPAKLKLWNQFYIAKTKQKTISLTKTKSEIEIEFTIESSVNDSINIKYYINNSSATFANEINKTIALKKGTNNFIENVTLENPVLWFPRGLRYNDTLQPELYEFSLIARSLNYADETRLNFGLRKIQLIQEEDKSGTSFYFRINGLPVYAQGYNVTGEVDEYYFANSNFNLLRVWGGAEYLSDEFYEMADSYGVMIWQDFMFSGSYYPADSNFLKNLDAEFSYQIERIAQHPSLVLWCGNNEIDVAAKNWGWEKKYNYTLLQQQNFKKDYEKLFLNIIPSYLKKIDPNTPYIHSSPLSNWGKPEDFNSGDNHYWGVWHGEESIDSFATKIPRFASEFGFPALPFNPVHPFGGNEIGSNLTDILSNLMLSYKGHPLLERYIKENYKLPASLQEWVYFSQQTQAKALKKAIVAQKLSHKCKGSIVWQLNGGENVIDWSVIDAKYGPKPAYFTCEEVFEPVLPVFSNENDSLKIVLINNYPDELEECAIQIKIIDTKGKIYYSLSNSLLFYINYRLINKNNESYISLYPDHIELKIPISAIKNSPALHSLILTYEITLPNKKSTKGYSLLVDEKEFQFNKAKINWKISSDSSYLVLKSETFVAGLNLSIDHYTSPFKINNTYLLPGEEKIIPINLKLSGIENLKLVNTKFESLNDYLGK